jgi:hypothetical protein
MDIEANLRTYLGSRQATARYSSFDYCFNHFQGHRNRAADLRSPTGMELSCLHLGFYLASWGMLRGSSPLLRRSVKHYEPVIEAIAAAPPQLWEADAHSYDDDTIDMILTTRRRLRAALPDASSDILISKIMLGVFGCVPAFDTYFKRGFGVWTFGAKALRKVAAFYDSHAEVIDKHRVNTLDFASGVETDLLYSRAKVIDMIFFIEGGPAGDAGVANDDR